jgi:membrane-associated protease RseP (regulator of RpoE activity)
MHSVSLNRRANPRIELPKNSFSSRIGRGMSGAMTGEVGRIAGFELGGHRLASVVATFPDSAFESPRGLDQRDGNLGGGILGRFNITFDYVGKRMFIVPNQRFGRPFDWDMTGITFDIAENGTIQVKSLVPGSPAAAAGVKLGEVLVAVNGTKAVPRDLIRERDRFRQEGKEVVLTLREQGKDRQVKLKLKRLV